MLATYKPSNRFYWTVFFSNIVYFKLTISLANYYERFPLKSNLLLICNHNFPTVMYCLSMIKH